MSILSYAPTARQYGFLRALIAEKQLDDAANALVEEARADAVAGTLTRERASEIISLLSKLPKKSEAAAESGVYVIDGEYHVRVYLGQQSGKMLAKRIVIGPDNEVSYDYVGAASSVFRSAYSVERLSLEEVGRLGIATGQCLVCGRRLDDPESVDRGIGPVCAEKY